MSTLWLLHFIHFLHAAFFAVATFAQRCKRKQPQPLAAQRSKIPKHLCLNLVSDDDMPVQETETAFLQCLQSVAGWCRELGIETLSVYDRHGILYGCSKKAYERDFLLNKTLEGSYKSKIDHLTSPLSAPSNPEPPSSRHTTFPTDLNVMHLGNRENVAVLGQPRGQSVSSAANNLELYVASCASGKPAIVSASRRLLQTYVDTSVSAGTKPSKLSYNLTVPELGKVLEASFPSPDFMIIHHVGGMKAPHPPIEFQGFPPWQNSLAEFHRTHPDDCQHGSRSESGGSPELISETAFRRALDEYSMAEFRRGK